MSQVNTILSSKIHPVKNNEKKYLELKLIIHSNKLINRAIWIYFLLLVFEGALRKWILPGLATPLLIIRDPVAIWILLMSVKYGVLRFNWYVSGMVLIGLVGIFTAILFGHGNITVAVYGARILILHFPIIFVIGKVFNRNDVIKLGKATLWLCIPITILVAFQFYSPQSAWVNRGVGGDLKGAGFSGALGYSRPPATFSFTSGTTQFYSFVACYIVYFWLQPRDINKFFLIVATICLLTIIPLSISRSLFFQVCITLIFAFIALIRKPKHIAKIIMAGSIGFVAVLFLNHTSFFNTAVEAFSSRFEGANEVEGGIKGVLGDRFLGGMIGAFSSASDLPFFGYGIGMGTNVGSMLLTGGTFFLIAEGEWGRLIGELGPIMGLAVIYIRLNLTLKIAVSCYNKLLIGDLLPWILLSFGLLVVPQGNWAQPTSLGFCIVLGGLLIASLRIPKEQVSKKT